MVYHHVEHEKEAVAHYHHQNHQNRWSWNHQNLDMDLGEVKEALEMEF